MYIHRQSQIAISTLGGFQNIRKKFKIMDSFTLTQSLFEVFDMAETAQISWKEGNHW